MAFSVEDVKSLVSEAVKAALRETQEASAASQKSIVQDMLNCGRDDPQKMIDSLNARIPKFVYDPEADQTFEKWINRWKPVVDTDGRSLPESTVKQFLISKLDSKEYDRFVAYLLPAKPEDEKLADIISTLKTLFGQPASLFRRRFKFLQSKRDGLEITDLVGLINTRGEAASLEKLTPENLKCLVLVNALSAPEDLELRTRALRKLDDDTTTLKSLANELINYTQLKIDATGTSESGSTVQYVQKANRKQPHRQQSGSKPPPSPCSRCGATDHWRRNCPHTKTKCANCNKIGHLASVCRARTPRAEVRRVQISALKRTRIRWPVKINSKEFSLVLDTGADVTLIASKTWKALGAPKLKPSNVELTQADGSPLRVFGCLEGEIELNGNTFSGMFYVTEDLDLLGLEWLEHDKPFYDLLTRRQPSTTSQPEVTSQQQVSNIKKTDSQQNKLAKELEQTFPEVFAEGLGKCTKYQASIKLKPGCNTVFRKARPVAYAMLPAVSAEIERLEHAGVLERTSYSDFAAPIVVVKKPSGEIRMCGDYSTGLNDIIEDDHYPLPTAEDIFSTLNGGRFFSQIDLTEAYLQIPLDESTQQILSINTPKGLYKVKRLPFGIKTAPSCFQRIMDKLTAGLEGTTAYLDDILVTGSSETEHRKRLIAVMSRLRDFGLRIRLEKCSFLQPEIKFLGFIINAKGRKPDPEKIKPIVDMPAPKNVSELRAFIGMLSFYGAFIAEMEDLKTPMIELLKKDTKFSWSSECEQAFQRSKEILQSDLLLMHFDPKLPIVVSADASQKGIGGVLLHRLNDGSMKAVLHTARTLTATEQRYSQIEKEALALVHTVRKFHKFLYGRKFTLNTDHKPLLSVFQPNKGVPAYTANRLQRWAIILLAYNFEIRYKNTKEFGEADALSRLMDSRAQEEPLLDTVIASIETAAQVDCMSSIEILPTTVEDVQKETKADQLLATTMKYVRDSRWPSIPKNDPLFPLYARRDTLSIVGECLMMADRVIIPKALRDKVLKLLHEGHPGISKMKALARSHVYWPGIDSDIENVVKQCESCQLAGKLPRKVPMESLSLGPPWSRLHADIAGPVEGNYFLIVVDSTSKWPEVKILKKITAEAIMSVLEEIFARFGNPRILVTDNGPQFRATEIQKFCRERNIHHIFSAPYHPQSNGMAEKCVDTVKRTLKKLEGEGTVAQNLQKFLSTYRNTPSPALPDGKTPAQILLGHSPRTTLDLLTPSKPSQAEENSDYRERMKTDFDQHHGARKRKFEISEKVYATFHTQNHRQWKAGFIRAKKGTNMYEVEVDNKVHIRHANQLKPRYIEEKSTRDTWENIGLQLALTLPLAKGTDRSVNDGENIEHRTDNADIDQEVSLRSHRFEGIIPDIVVEEHSETTTENTDDTYVTQIAVERSPISESMARVVDTHSDDKSDDSTNESISDEEPMSIMEEDDPEVAEISRLLEELPRDAGASAFRERCASASALPPVIPRPLRTRPRSVSPRQPSTAPSDPASTPLYGGGRYPPRLRMQPSRLNVKHTTAKRYEENR